MKQKYHLKRFCLLAFLLFAILAIPSMDAQAAKVKPKTGTYIKRFHGEGFDAYGTVIIKKMSLFLKCHTAERLSVKGKAAP